MSDRARRSDGLCPRCGERLDRIRISPGGGTQRGCRACGSWEDSASPARSKESSRPSGSPAARPTLKKKLRPSICQGITELRAVAARIYGIRVERRLVAKLEGVAGLLQAHPKSDLFCVEVTAMENSPESALQRFKEIVAKAGLGHHFGVPR